MSIMAGRARKQRRVIRLSKARIAPVCSENSRSRFAPGGVTSIFGTTRTGRSPLEMSVHSGEAVMSIPHSK